MQLRNLTAFARAATRRVRGGGEKGNRRAPRRTVVRTRESHVVEHTWAFRWDEAGGEETGDDVVGDDVVGDDFWDGDDFCDGDGTGGRVAVGPRDGRGSTRGVRRPRGVVPRGGGGARGARRVSRGRENREGMRGFRRRPRRRNRAPRVTSPRRETSPSPGVSSRGGGDRHASELKFQRTSRDTSRDYQMTFR